MAMIPLVSMFVTAAHHKRDPLINQKHSCNGIAIDEISCGIGFGGLRFKIVSRNSTSNSIKADQLTGQVYDEVLDWSAPGLSHLILDVSEGFVMNVLRVREVNGSVDPNCNNPRCDSGFWVLL